jgi:hypothetical protein
VHPLQLLLDGPPTTVALSIHHAFTPSLNKLVSFTSPQSLAVLIAGVGTKVAGARVFCQLSLCVLVVDEVIVEQHS